MWPNKLPSFKHKYVTEKIRVQKLCFPRRLIRFFVGQYVNQQGIYLYSEATTYASGIKFTGDQ